MFVWYYCEKNRIYQALELNNTWVKGRQIQCTLGLINGNLVIVFIYFHVSATAQALEEKKNKPKVVPPVASVPNKHKFSFFKLFFQNNQNCLNLGKNQKEETVPPNLPLKTEIPPHQDPDPEANQTRTKENIKNN